MKKQHEKKPFKKPAIVARGKDVRNKNFCGRAGCQGK